MRLQQVQDIPGDWSVYSVKKKTPVRIRQAVKVEMFKVSWQDAELVSDPEVDFIVIQPNGSEYPCKKDIFWETYEEQPGQCFTSDFSDKTFLKDYIKKAQTTIVQIPEGESVEILTLEGTLPAVSYPDYIAIGVRGELYANTKDFVDNNLIFV
jgi:hypothetical protein